MSNAKVRHRRRRRAKRQYLLTVELRRVLMDILDEDIWSTTKSGFDYYISMFPAQRVVIL